MQQSTALSILKTGANVFLTGSAGTGKTYVLNQYISYLKSRKIRTAVTASTGIAATHLNGLTLHSWSGIGVRMQLHSSDLSNMSKKKYLQNNLNKVKVLVIDEISMLHKKQLDLTDLVLRHFKGNNKPFGGVQVVFCGDFFQLPPVGDHGELNRDKFAFMSPAWVDANPVICYLTEQYRQTDSALNQILDQIRAGRISSSTIDMLKSATRSTSKIPPTRLYTHNADVDVINNQCLQELKGDTIHFKAKTTGNEKLVATLTSSVLADSDMALKKDARVMFVKNNYEVGYANGSLGRVVGFNSLKLPIVELTDGKRIEVAPEKWTVLEDTGKTLASFTQIPLRLAWAITVHKSQGMTLEAAEIDLSKTFERGQGYVALSRLKSLSTLQLLGLNTMALEVDGLAKKADVRFQELSDQAEQQYAKEDVEELAKSFVVKVGGITDEKEIKRQKGRIATASEKSSTLDVTKQAVERGDTIREIADQRGLTEATIIGHIGKLRKLHPEMNLSRFKPKSGVINKVKKALDIIKADDQFEKGNGISLGAIYNVTGKKVTYDNIKLALIFLD